MIQYPLFHKAPLEIITLFSTVLVQLQTVLFWKDKRKRETANSSYISLSTHCIYSRLLPENWAVQTLHLCLIPTKESAMDTGFLKQPKKSSALPGNRDAICGSCLLLKIQQPWVNSQATLGLNAAAFFLMSEDALCRGDVETSWYAVLEQIQEAEKKNE